MAEDDPVSRLLAVRLLERLGHRATAVTIGKQALESLAKGGFDLVLMDVRMPELDGVEATRIIRHEPRLRVDPRVPVVALTAERIARDPRILALNKERRRECMGLRLGPVDSKCTKVNEALGQAIVQYVRNRCPGDCRCDDELNSIQRGRAHWVTALWLCAPSAATLEVVVHCADCRMFAW